MTTPRDERTPPVSQTAVVLGRTSPGAGRIEEILIADLAVTPADHDHTTAGDGGVLTNDVHDGYSDYGEIAEPAMPGVNTARLYAVDQNDRAVVEIKNPSGLVLRPNRDNVFVAKNDEAGVGTTIPKGSVVYVSGSTGANEQIRLWLADGSISVDHVGLAYEDSGHNDFTFVLTLGKISGINTDLASITEGGRVYASAATPGAFTGTEPAHPNLRAELGVCTRKHAVQGEIAVVPLVVRGNFQGTRQNDWRIGDGAAGAKTVKFVADGTKIGTVSMTPTAARAVTIQDADGTLYQTGGTDVAVADGGTGASTLADRGVLIGRGTAAVEASAAGASGQVLVALGASTSPAFALLSPPFIGLRPGSLGGSIPVWAITQNSGILTSGRLRVTPIYLYSGMTVTYLSFVSATTPAGTPTNWWFALYTGAGALMAQTADQTTTAWAANELKTLALSAPQAIVTTGVYYAAIMVKATTVPNFQTAGGATGATAVHTNPQGNTSDTGLTTTAPDPFGPITANSNIPWCEAS